MRSFSVAIAAALIVFWCSAGSAVGQTVSPVLYAWGSGTVAIDGAGTVDITCRGFMIVDNATDVYTEGSDWYSLDLENGKKLYVSVKGNALLSGNTMDVLCGGASITVNARCNGVVTLTGAGYYVRGLRVGFWDAEGVAVEVGIQ